MSTATAKCIHELDVVRLRAAAGGWSEPDGRVTSWPAGTVGTVVVHDPGGAWCEVEVVADSGETLGFVSARADALEVTHPYRAGAEPGA